MLIMPSIIDDVMLEVKPSQFALPMHGHCCRIMFDLRSKGKTVDTVAVFRGLKAAKFVEDNDGVVLLEECMAATPHAGHWRYHAELVREASTRQALQKIATQIGYMASDVGRELSEVVGEADKLIRGLLEDESIAGQPKEMMDLLVDIKVARDSGMVRTGISTGYSDLDLLTGGLFRGQMVIIAARPSVGKTALALNLAKRIGEIGMRTLIVSIEQSSHEIGDRYLAMESGMSLYDLRRTDLDEMEQFAITEAYNRMAALPILIEDRTNLTPTAISALARSSSRRAKLDCIIVDYLQFVPPDDRKAPREQQVADTTRKLKYLAKDLDVPVIVLAQLNRKSEEGNQKPQLWHLRESGSIEQDADQVWLMWGPKMNGDAESIMGTDFDNPPTMVEDAGGLDVEIIVAKNRNGKTGSAKLYFRKTCFRFDPVSYRSEPDGFDERVPYSN